MKEFFHYSQAGEMCGPSVPIDIDVEESNSSQILPPPREWSFFEKRPYKEPAAYRIHEINSEPSGRKRVIQAVMYSFELAEIIKPIEELVSELESPPTDMEASSHPKIHERIDSLAGNDFGVEESTYNSVYSEVVEIVDRLEHVTITQKQALLQLIPNPNRMPVLKQLDMMSRPHKHPKTKEPVSVLLEENTAWQALTALRYMIAKRKGFEAV